MQIKSELGNRAIIFSSILFSLIFLFLVEFGEVNAQIEDEIKRVYSEGYNTDTGCKWLAFDDVYAEKLPDPNGAVKGTLEKVSNPYIDNPGFKEFWENGFSASCIDEYMPYYVEVLWGKGEYDVPVTLGNICEKGGYDDGKAGKPREPSKFAIQQAQKMPFYKKLSGISLEQQYVEGWQSKCGLFWYDMGYERGEKETSDLALAKEVGDKLGIKEEQVVEFFGGEEGVKEAYEKNCIIATASYGSPMAKEVQMLREIRDNQLLQTQSGSAFMSGFNTVYYSFAPTIAQWEQENPAFKEIVKTTITPLITSLSLLNHVSMDSEAEVLGYGISLILLNIGMYFVAPATVVWQVKKRI